MNGKRHERKEEIIHRLAAEFVRDNSGKSSLITVTRVELYGKGKEARIFFTTLPESEEDTAEKFLVRKTNEFKTFVRDHSRLGVLPYFHFKIDYGERNRQRLDELSREL